MILVAVTLRDNETMKPLCVPPHLVEKKSANRASANRASQLRDNRELPFFMDIDEGVTSSPRTFHPLSL